MAFIVVTLLWLRATLLPERLAHKANGRRDFYTSTRRATLACGKREFSA
jgi:hypothetical protein